ncbi:hypothetical protein [Methylomonas koyamae]|uniref:hypothetical protein n=1 Tax=Methylomonas koyamae TaxID=702114 RepID=UPI0012F6F3CD|nr:hypothetical protein [Methylomonas koyamae]
MTGTKKPQWYAALLIATEKNGLQIPPPVRRGRKHSATGVAGVSRKFLKQAKGMKILLGHAM